MKMVKSLLLGTAAGLVAVTAGQAAELPVKARPVQYVKVCSLYGAGFYYMPGTDMCLKIGGWVRAEVTGGDMNGSMTWGPYADNLNQRSTSNLVTRERGYITADAREETAYGVARAYIDVGVSSSDIAANAAPFSSNRAFLQWAGFTAGLATSFYDFYSAPAPLYRAGYLPNEDTGDGGIWVWAYTAQLGGGLSATLSAEQRRVSQIIGIAGGHVINGGTLTGLAIGGGNGYGGLQMPDVVANLRIDQAWGAAQIMGALHEDNGLYYGGDAGVAADIPADGHPGDAWGWVIGAGLKLNAPMISQGDYFQGEVNYTEGALRYLNVVEPNWDEVRGDNQVWGVETDCVYKGTLNSALLGNTTSGCELTSAWSINASYEHYWTPQWHQSLAGVYEQVSYDDTANDALCSAEYGVAPTAAVPHPGVALAGAGCSNNWSVWGIGSRLQWDITKSFYIGVEALYEDFTGGKPAGVNATGVAGLPGGVALGGATNSVSSMGDWQFTLRMHKDFLP